MKRILNACLILLTVSSQHPALSSRVEVTEVKDGEPIITVISDKPETSYSGQLGFDPNSWGYRSVLTQQYLAGEEFCMYTAVLGMRNLSCHIILTKYWDADVEVTLRDSDGQLISQGNVTAVGTRSPYAELKYDNIPRPDIVSLCVRNHGSTKTVFHLVYMYLIEEKNVAMFREMFNNLTTMHNTSAESLGRVQDQLQSMLMMTKLDYSILAQDYFRLMNIATGVDRRGIINSILMLICCGSSTLLIRRWFGAPRSTV